MSTPTTSLADFLPFIAPWPAASAVVRAIEANSGVTTPKLSDFSRAKAGS